MTNYFKLPTWADSDHVYAVVETPRGSRAKLEFDPRLGAFTLAKPLLAGLTYPFFPSWRLARKRGGRRPARRSHHSRRRDLSRARADMQADRRARGRSIIEGKEGAKRPRVCRAGSLALRRRPAGHPAASIEGDQGTGEILRGDERARTQDIAIPGMAWTGEGHQDHQEGVALNPAELVSGAGERGGQF